MDAVDAAGTAGAGAVTPAQFGEDYYASLQELTFNSRPIIESHTTLALENTEFASEIVAAVERRIEKAIPAQKLFALYLLDSITKNIGLPYTTLFSHNLYRTFTQTYGLVDDATRCKLIKLFKTWKVPTAMTGMPLFDVNQLNKIEQFLIKVTNPNINPNSNSNTPTPIMGNISLNRVNSKDVLIKEVDELLSMVNSRCQSSPSDEKGQQRFKLLNQLKAIISSKSTIPQAQLDEVAKQLQTIREDEIMKLNALKHQQQQQQQQSLPFSASQLQGLLNLNMNMNNRGTPSGNSVQNTQPNFNAILSPPQSTSTLTPPSTNPLGLKNISFLENILKKSANKSNESTTTTTTSNRVDFKFIKPTEEAILEDFVLTQSFINHNQPNNAAISLLYEYKPIQCNQCSKRFSDDDNGTLQKRKHEEWHRRVEMRMNIGGSGLGGVVNRSWYLSENEWVEFNYDDDDENDKNVIVNANANANVNVSNEKKTSKSIATASVRITNNVDDRRDRDEKIDLKDAPNHRVRIPESSNNEVVCGICRDMLVGVFDEESGDWIWKNAVEAKNRVWHWSCWMEAKMRRKRDMSPTR